MLAELKKRMRRRMSSFRPKSFRDHYEYALFFDVRNDLFAGDDLMVLEYPDAQVQERIFAHAVEKFELHEAKILDVGCGLGYLKKFLDTHAPGYSSYKGIDLSEKMIAGACQRFGDYFERRDVLSQPFEENEFDIVFLLSVLGYPITPDPFGYMATLLRALFRVAGRGLVLSHLAPGRRQDPTDFTVPPESLADWCRQNLSPHVVLDDTLGLITYEVAVRKE